MNTDRCTRQNEKIAPDVFIAKGATVVGDVTLEEGSSVWFGAVIRGDTQPIVVGKGSNVQDLALMHADKGFPCELGKNVTVGHAAIVHGAIVEDDCLIGIRATLLNGVRIGKGSLVAAGALVTEGTIIPPGSVVMGSPATVKRSVTERDLARIQYAPGHYRKLAAEFREAGQNEAS